MRYETVQHQSCQERSQDAFHTHELHQARSQKDHGKHENKLHHIIVVAAEKPTSDTRERIHNQSSKKDNLNHQPQPEQTAGLPLEQTAHHSQYQQCKRIRHRRTSHSNAYTAMAGHAVTNHNRVRHQRVRSIHTCQQYGRHEAVLQQHHIGDQADAYRNDKSQQSQHYSLSAVLLEVAHIHFQTCQKHDIIKPDLAEQLKTAVAHQDIKTMFSNHQTGQNHADNVRYTQFIQQYGRKQYNKEYKEEYPCRVCYRKC